MTLEELKLIADVMGVTFEQSFIFPDGEQIKQVMSEENHGIRKEKY